METQDMKNKITKEKASGKVGRVDWLIHWRDPIPPPVDGDTSPENFHKSILDYLKLWLKLFNAGDRKNRKYKLDDWEFRDVGGDAVLVYAYLYPEASEPSVLIDHLVPPSPPPPPKDEL